MMSALEIEPRGLEPRGGTQTPAARRRGHAGVGRNAGLMPYLLILPAVAALVGVVLYPVGKLIVTSMQDLTLKDLLHVPPLPAQWVGFKHFGDMFSDPAFWHELETTALFMALNVALSILIGLGLAVLLARISRWARLTLTAVMLFAWVMPSIVSAQLFLWMFNTQYGVINWLLSRIPGVHMMGHDWLANPYQALYLCVTGVVVWGALPFLTITLHAGITQIPRELTEAAVVDGAGPVQVFRHVTLPKLGSLLVIVTTLSVIWDFNVFNQIWAFWGGIPNPKIYTLGIRMYVQMSGNQFGQGSATALFTMVLLCGLMVFYIRQLFRIGDAD
jgi:N,N'-diacetylchitobiose transport system permease protein